MLGNKSTLKFYFIIFFLLCTTSTDELQRGGHRFDMVEFTHILYSDIKQSIILGISAQIKLTAIDQIISEIENYWSKKKVWSIKDPQESSVLKVPRFSRTFQSLGSCFCCMPTRKYPYQSLKSSLLKHKYFSCSKFDITLEEQKSNRKVVAEKDSTVWKVSKYGVCHVM